MIDVQNLTKQFDGTTVLDGVSATFRDGEVNMIIGQSGSGKTVLMKSMIGLHKPESGRILYGEGASARNICAMSESELRLLHREVGMLFQGSALFDSQTVVENVMFPLEMFSDMNPDQIVERAHFCLERVNIPERAYRLMPGDSPCHCPESQVSVLR